MTITNPANNPTPLVTPNGEIIYELVGRFVEPKNERHSIAKIILPTGKASILHYHPEAEETYHILSGTGRVKLGNEESTLTPGDTILIPPPLPHKIWNDGTEDLIFIAVCVPAWELENSVFLDED